MKIQLKKVTLGIFLGGALILCNALLAQSVYDAMKEQVKGLYTSFRASVAITSSSGQITTGKIMYQYPGKLRLETATGIIATNGTHLWIHNKASAICARQDVSGVSGGLLGVLSRYEGVAQGGSFVFKKPGAYYDEIIVQAAGGMIRSVKLKHDEESTTYSFSNVQIDTGISGAMFNYKPSGAQIIENPLNQ